MRRKTPRATRRPWAGRPRTRERGRWPSGGRPGGLWARRAMAMTTRGRTLRANPRTLARMRTKPSPRRSRVRGERMARWPTVTPFRPGAGPRTRFSWPASWRCRWVSSERPRMARRQKIRASPLPGRQAHRRNRTRKKTCTWRKLGMGRTCHSVRSWRRPSGPSGTTFRPTFRRRRCRALLRSCPRSRSPPTFLVGANGRGTGRLQSGF
mmetsp:Transcript_5018/g.15213  ORF Transcript_5018/g.15213 Transcript_5018/m.15213 type:complete len:209 (-) Transcript_5018:398-1024(-)